MFRNLKPTEEVSLHSSHAFSDILKEFGVLYIQDGDIYVPSHTGIISTIKTPEIYLTKPFEKIGSREQFEKDLFRTMQKTRSTNETISMTCEEIFFHNLIEEYLTNKPDEYREYADPKKEFCANSPISKTKTTLITPHSWITLGGKHTNSTTTYLYQNKEQLCASKTQALKDLSQAYREQFIRQHTKGKIKLKHEPIYEKKHTRAYFGEHAIKREIEIRKKGQGYFDIITYCPKSQAKVNGEIYHFDETTLTTPIRIHNDFLKLCDYPSTHKGYEHVFVWDTGRVCYNGDTRFKHIGLTTDEIALNSIRNTHTVNLVKCVLDEGPKTLLFGDTHATTYATQVSELQHRKEKTKTTIESFALTEGGITI